MSVVLADGKVLFIGGFMYAGANNGTRLATTTIYDPVTNTWQPGRSLNIGRSNGLAVTRTDGRRHGRRRNGPRRFVWIGRTTERRKNESLSPGGQ
jgi:hypothetical protein